jgi:hypothetical protein
MQILQEQNICHFVLPILQDLPTLPIFNHAKTVAAEQFTQH